MSKERELLREIEQMLESRAWRVVVEAVQEQTDALQQTILFSPCNGLDSAMAMEYKKGQLEGRLSLSDTVGGLMASLQLDVQREKGDEE